MFRIVTILLSTLVVTFIIEPVSAQFLKTSGTRIVDESGNDGIDIETSIDNDPGSNGYNVGWTQDGEWMQYTTTVDTTAAFSFQIRYAGAASKIRLMADDGDLSTVINLPATGGYQVWNYAVVNDIVLYKGTQKLKLQFDKGGANIGFLKAIASKPVADVEFKPVYAETIGETNKICLTLNQKADPSTLLQEGFSLTINGLAVQITGLIIHPDNSRELIITPGQAVYDGDEIKLNYSGNHVASVNHVFLLSFVEFPVKNNLPVHLAIPGKIEAEAFSANQGLQLENTTDTGGGQNIGYTNSGDFLEYMIHVNKTGRYKLEVRTACLNSAGILEFQQKDLGRIL